MRKEQLAFFATSVSFLEGEEKTLARRSPVARNDPFCYALVRQQSLGLTLKGSGPNHAARCRLLLWRQFRCCLDCAL